jgi:hypothetical protein
MNTAFWIGLGLVSATIGLVIAFGAAKKNPTEIWDTFEPLIKKMGIRSVQHTTLQSYQDVKALGVYVEFFATYDQYMELRKKANEAGLYFNKPDWEDLNVHFLYKVYLTQDRRTYDQGQ